MSNNRERYTLTNTETMEVDGRMMQDGMAPKGRRRYEPGGFPPSMVSVFIGVTLFLRGQNALRFLHMPSQVKDTSNQQPAPLAMAHGGKDGRSRTNSLVEAGASGHVAGGRTPFFSEGSQLSARFQHDGHSMMVS